MLFCGVRVPNSLQVVLTVLLVASVQHARCEKYIDKNGYLKWNLGSNVLQGAESRLEFRFRYCNNKGVLIYQQGEGRNFFALGVNDEKLYIEASIGGLAVEMYVGEVARNQTHDVTITGLRTLNDQTTVIINGNAYSPEILTDVNVNLDFSSNVLIGETLIGGYESIDQLRLNTQRLKAYPITCITFIRAGQANIDLDSPSSQLGVSDECIVCLPPSIVTLTTVTSYLRMKIDNNPRSNTVISLKFRTKAPDGLLFYFGGPAYVALYLEGGALVLRLNTRGSGSDEKFGIFREIVVNRTGNLASLYEVLPNGVYDQLAEVNYDGKNCSVIRNCYNFPCLNGAQCIELDTPTPSAAGRNCSCAPGYKGVDCGQDCDECSEQCNSGMCVNSISCENRIGDFVCECKRGYEGKDCNSEIDHCKDGPCGAGICHNYLTGYNCTCPDNPTGAVPNRQSCGSPYHTSTFPAAATAAIVVCLGIVLVLVIVFVAFRARILDHFHKQMSRQTAQDQENQEHTIPQDPVYQEINPATLADVTYMGLQPLNPHADMSTQTENSESHAYQPLSRETMETSGYSSLQPTNNQDRSGVNQGEDDYENPDQDFTSQEGHRSDGKEVTLDLQEDEYLEIVG